MSVRRLCLFLLLVLALVGLGCPGSAPKEGRTGPELHGSATPEEAAQAFVQALEANSREDLIALVSREYAPQQVPDSYLAQYGGAKFKDLKVTVRPRTEAPNLSSVRISDQIVHLYRSKSSTRFGGNRPPVSDQFVQ